MKYASLTAGRGDVVIGKTSFTFLKALSIPQRLLYSFGIVFTSLLTSRSSTLVADGMNFRLLLLQHTTIVKDASFFELSWIENGSRPSFPNESTAPCTLSLQTQGMMNSSPSPFRRLMHSTVKKALSRRRRSTFTPLFLAS